MQTTTPPPPPSPSTTLALLQNFYSSLSPTLPPSSVTVLSTYVHSYADMLISAAYASSNNVDFDMNNLTVTGGGGGSSFASSSPNLRRVVKHSDFLMAVCDDGGYRRAKEIINVKDEIEELLGGCNGVRDFIVEEEEGEG